MSWLVFILLLVIVALLLQIPLYRAVRPLYQRECAGVRWRRRYRNASAQEIRDFLQLFVDSFGFPRKHRLRFRPEDKVMDLYRALNPPNWSIGDNMELESLIDDFRARYHIDLVPLWREDITLGEVFAHAGFGQEGGETPARPGV